jgi:tetratricopeptide (TPR) repeat protein
VFRVLCGQTRNVSRQQQRKQRDPTVQQQHAIILFGMLSLVLALAALANTQSEQHQRGVDLYKHAKYAEAISLLQDAIRSEQPNSLEYKESALLIGQSYFMLLQAPSAIPWLEKVPNVTEASYMLGYAYLQTNQVLESERAFARLFGLAPDSAKGHLLAAQMMLKREYQQQALDEVEKCLNLDPKLPEAHFLRGEIRIARGQLDEAIADMQQELAINPNFSMAWYRLGDTYQRKEAWDTAVPHLQRAAWLNPDYSGPFILLGKCYFKQGNYSNAEGILRRALQLDPRNQSATYLLGQTLIAEGKQEEGRATLEKWKELKGSASAASPQ